MQTAAIIATQDYDDNCKCYVKCTGNPDIDAKCSYELLFGPNKYENFIKQMKREISPGDAEDFDKLTSGKDISNFIIGHINDYMVQSYMDDLGINSGARKTILDDIDGINRTELSRDEKKNDLIQLLSDYKENGRNPSCRCQSVANAHLDEVCSGVKHWVKGWSWQAIYESIFRRYLRGLEMAQ